jgi:L-histidine N-alpha-methyltransferase
LAKKAAYPSRKDGDAMTADGDAMTALKIMSLLPPGFLCESLRADALAGLTRTPKRLPPKWFYDDAGSDLFEQITRLPEYYPTRAERAILRAHAGDIAIASRAHTLVELGSGSAEKTVLLLDALRDADTLRRFIPVDVSEAALLAARRRVRNAYPDLTVLALVSDFEEHLGLPAAQGPRLVAFLGGTIGNLEPAERAEFLGSLRAGLGNGDSVLLGTDLVKDPAILVAAYDDAAGVTAAFNKNVLNVLNRELDADFDLDAFEHVAAWDAANEWIEMRLRSRMEQTVKLGALSIDVAFAAGEEMRTEVSAKFREEGVRAELAEAGFEMRSWWTDSEGRFALSLSVAA